MKPGFSRFARPGLGVRFLRPNLYPSLASDLRHLFDGQLSLVKWVARNRLDVIVVQVFPAMGHVNEFLFGPGP